MISEGHVQKHFGMAVSRCPAAGSGSFITQRRHSEIFKEFREKAYSDVLEVFGNAVFILNCQAIHKSTYFSSGLVILVIL